MLKLTVAARKFVFRHYFRPQKERSRLQKLYKLIDINGSPVNLKDYSIE